MNASKLILLTLITFCLWGCNGCDDDDNSGNTGTDSVPVPETTPCVANPDSGSLAMNTYFQEQSNWCWAACGQMVMECVGDTLVKQCDAVNSRLGKDSCCSPDSSTVCNWVGYIEFEKFGFDVDSISKALTWDEIREQIDCKKSPICSIRETRGWDFSHMVVASGYTTAAGLRQVLIRNPSQDFTTQPAYLIPYHFSDSNPFEQYDSTTYYTHGNDYFNIKKKIN